MFRWLWSKERKEADLRNRIRKLGFCPIHETPMTRRVYGVPVKSFCRACIDDDNNDRKTLAAKLITELKEIDGN